MIYFGLEPHQLISILPFGPFPSFFRHLKDYFERSSQVLDDFVGRVLGGKYELKAILGQGGMGAVFRALDQELDRIVAVKVIKPDHALSPKAVDNFIKEARIIARLSGHVHILTVHALDKAENIECPIYLVMELADGGTLADKARMGPMLADEVLSIARQVGEALDYAHSQNVVHLDLKPNNILFDDKGNVLVADFGLAKILESATHVKADTGAGTRDYMPPEQYFGGEAGIYSDVFALGITLHELLTGNPPGRGLDDAGNLQVFIDSSLPPGIASVIRKSTEYDPRQRYQTAGELVNAFASALREPDTVVTSTVSPPDVLIPVLPRLEQECMRWGVKIVSTEHRSNFFRVRVTDHVSESLIDIYTGKKGITAVLGGPKDTSLAPKVASIIANVFNNQRSGEAAQKHRTFMVGRANDRVKIASALKALEAADEKQEANCDYRLDFVRAGNRVIVRQFANGTLTVQRVAVGIEVGGLFDNICECIEKVLGSTLPGGASNESGPSPPKSKGKKDPTQEIVLMTQRPFDPPWIGTDESGKGDYFGPLVSAAVYVDESILDKLARLGVRDSKRLSDNQNRKLAQKIRATCEGLYAEVVVPPDRYNDLYEQFRREGKTLTLLLAWCHARALEDLLDVVDCSNVIADQFADKRYLQSRLLAKGRAKGINLFQTPRAEANLAVAAASILARDRFLVWIEQESQKYKMILPKGASAEVVRAAQNFVQRFGEAELRKVAKLHFKTTASVLGIK
jgi:ribonuclease HIII